MAPPPDRSKSCPRGPRSRPPFRRGDADVTLGLESVARSYGLRFVPLVQERFDLLVDRKAYFDPAMQDLLAFCHDPAFRQRAESLGGYDLADFGRVVWNG